MPTAARLIAALCLAAVGYVVSQLVIPLLPDSKPIGNFVAINAALGLLVGWIVMGRRGGRGFTAAINNGLTGVAVLVFWGIAVQACGEMFRLAMRHRYDGPVEAVAAIFQIGFDYLILIATVPIGVTLIVAAVISGYVTDVAFRRLR